MITADEINLCVEYLKKHPNEAREFLKSIGVIDSAYTYPTTFFIYDENKSECTCATVCSDDALYERILTLCAKNNATLSYYVLDRNKNYERVFYESDKTEESIKNTLKDWLSLFYSEARFANLHDLCILKGDKVIFSIYGENEYICNCEFLYDSIIPVLREISVDKEFKNILLEAAMFCGYSKTKFVNYMNKFFVRNDEEKVFIETLKDMYKGSCCYPHEVTPCYQ